MEDVADGAPLVHVGTLKRDELGRRVEDLPLANDYLMQRELVHEFVVVTRLRVSVDL